MLLFRQLEAAVTEIAAVTGKVAVTGIAEWGCQASGRVLYKEGKLLAQKSLPFVSIANLAE